MKLKIGLVLALFCFGCATPEAPPKKPTSQPTQPAPTPAPTPAPLSEVEKRTLLGEQNHLQVLMTSIATLTANMGEAQIQLAGLLVTEKAKKPVDYEKLGAIAGEQLLLKAYLKGLREVNAKLATRIIEIEEMNPRKPK
jgi:hypothetical protein